VPDALRQDVFYVQHALGVDSISVSPWITALREDRDDLPHSDVTQLVECNSSRPIEGLAAFSTVTLGYGLLALASTNQLAAVELEYQIPRRQPSPSTTLRSSEPDRSSLLLTQPLDFDRLLSSVRSARVDPKAALRKLPSPNQPVQSVSPEHLRVVGEIIAQLQNRLAAIRSASQAIEHRVDLQIREFQRQLELLKKSSATIKALKNDDTAERAEKMLEKQDKLAERMDLVVAALSADYRPEVGEVEKRWFDELEKLRTRVYGGGGFGLSRTRGLTSQVEQVSMSLE
jgi:nucleoporin NUP82